jgi:hypothetical protein
MQYKPINLEKSLWIYMNDKAWYIFYVLLFFSILIPVTIFLFHGDNSNSFNHRVTVIVMKPGHAVHIYPTQSLDLNNPNACMESLLNNLQSGNLDLNAFQDGVEKCFGLSLNDNGRNNTPIVPQPPASSNLQIV